MALSHATRFLVLLVAAVVADGQKTWSSPKRFAANLANTQGAEDRVLIDVNEDPTTTAFNEDMLALQRLVEFAQPYEDQKLQLDELIINQQSLWSDETEELDFFMSDGINRGFLRSNQQCRADDDCDGDFSCMKTALPLIRKNRCLPGPASCLSEAADNFIRNFDEEAWKATLFDKAGLTKEHFEEAARDSKEWEIFQRSETFNQLVAAARDSLPMEQGQTLQDAVNVCDADKQEEGGTVVYWALHFELSVGFDVAATIIWTFGETLIEFLRGTFGFEVGGGVEMSLLLGFIFTTGELSAVDIEGGAIITDFDLGFALHTGFTVVSNLNGMNSIEFALGPGIGGGVGIGYSTTGRRNATPAPTPGPAPGPVPPGGGGGSGPGSAAPSISVAPSTSSKPSSTPSISQAPSKQPSQAPSISAQPSQAPSTSSVPSKLPSQVPSKQPSNQPSSQPSQAPSNSQVPSKQPSQVPSNSHVPSKQPSQSPSLSQVPSKRPSQAPSISHVPSKQPSQAPSISQVPSKQPSQAPSKSQVPSKQPSQAPSISQVPSQAPSISQVPSTSQAPSQAPSISQAPSTSQAPSMPISKGFRRRNQSVSEKIIQVPSTSQAPNMPISKGSRRRNQSVSGKKKKDRKLIY